MLLLSLVIQCRYHPNYLWISTKNHNLLPKHNLTYTATKAIICHLQIAILYIQLLPTKYWDEEAAGLYKIHTLKKAHTHTHTHTSHTPKKQQKTHKQTKNKTKQKQKSLSKMSKECTLPRVRGVGSGQNSLIQSGNSWWQHPGSANISSICLPYNLKTKPI